MLSATSAACSMLRASAFLISSTALVTPSLKDHCVWPSHTMIASQARLHISCCRAASNTPCCDPRTFLLPERSTLAVSFTARTPAHHETQSGSGQAYQCLRMLSVQYPNHIWDIYAHLPHTLPRRHITSHTSGKSLHNALAALIQRLPMHSPDQPTCLCTCTVCIRINRIGWSTSGRGSQ